MANQRKAAVVEGKVHKHNNRRYRIQKHRDDEVEMEIEIDEDGEYEVQKLSLDGLPTAMPDGNPIKWFNNFAIKQGNRYIKQKYRLTIPGISNLGKSKLVILDSSGEPRYYTDAIVNDTIEMTDGDPATGKAP